MKEIAVRAFKKFGVSTAADGSEDFEIHLEGLEDYTFRIKEEDPDCDEADPFADLSDDGSFIEDSDQASDD